MKQKKKQIQVDVVVFVAIETKWCEAIRVEEEKIRQIERVVQREMYLWPNNISAELTYTNYSKIENPTARRCEGNAQCVYCCCCCWWWWCKFHLCCKYKLPLRNRFSCTCHFAQDENWKSLRHNATVAGCCYDEHLNNRSHPHLCVNTCKSVF